MVTKKETVVVAESMEVLEQIIEEAETKEKSNKNAIIEEDDEEDPVEENDEEISDEEIFDEEEEEEDNEEEENNNENQMEESISEEKQEENKNDDNAIQEVAEEKKEEENNNDNAIQEELAKEKKVDNAIEELSNEKKEEDKKEEKKEEEKKEEEKKEEGKTEPVSNSPGKKSKKRFRKKKNAKPESSVKTPPAKKAKTSAAGKDGEEEGPTPVTKDEKEGKKGKDKPETQGKKKVESMGMIFMCSSKTKKDCYQYNVFGLPASKKETVQKIYKGMRLFLYDIDLKLMYGIYKASAPGGYNLEPKAFNSAYPSQVRFTVMEDCKPLDEEKFKAVIKENYFSKNKFNPQLNSEQVKNLCKLFALSKSGTPKSKKPARSLKSAPVVPRPPSGRGGKIRKRFQDEPKRPPRSPRRPVRRNLDRRPFDRRPADYRPADRHVVYEREAFVQPPPPVVPPLSYSYETDAYRRDLPPPENRGRSYLDYEQTSRDRYYYREREPTSYTREYGYAPAPAPAPAPAAAEYNYLPAPALPPPRYNYPDPATSDYRSTEGMRADYRVPAVAEGRYSDYRSSARDRMYRL